MGDRAVVVEPATAWPGAGLLARADKLARLLAARRLLVWTSRAVEVIVALAAGEAARAELFLAGHSLDYEAVEEIAAARRVNALLYEGDAIPRVREARQAKFVPGAVYIVRKGPGGRPRARRVPARASWPPDPPANWLLIHPPASAAGLAVILAAAAGGGMLVVSGGGSPEALRGALRKHRVTHVSAGPGAWEEVLAAMVRGERIPHLKWLCVTGGSPELAARLARQFPQARVFTGFPPAE